MSYTITTEREGRGVLVTWGGNVTGQAMMRATEEMYAHDPDNRFEYQIWDFSDAESIEASFEDLRKLALLDYHYTGVNPKQILAIVGAPDIFLGLDHIYKLFAEVWTEFEAMTFPSISEARDWIFEKA